MSDTQHSYQTYISDMLALEQHVRAPFEAQLADGDFEQYATAQALLRRLSDLSNTHIDALKALLDREGGHQASPVKDAVSATAGFFAGAIDKIRKTKIAKSLRDDYTALSLCCVSYGMLLSTANAYGKADGVQLAQQHMRDYAQVLMEISDAMPEIVISDLEETGLDASRAAIEESRTQIEQVWRSSAAAEKGSSTTGEIATGTTTGQTIRSV
ncbi:MAG TPA: hypothetical protein VFL13_09810 [Candidatus Baltobacteraceae bacterium]|nr:hypothetical protein [Candidatus Baltobacteraceae bacterium]